MTYSEIQILLHAPEQMDDHEHDELNLEIAEFAEVLGEFCAENMPSRVERIVVMKDDFPVRAYP